MTPTEERLYSQERAAKWVRDKYQTDPEWRAKTLERVRAYQMRVKLDPELSRLQELRDAIYKTRRSINGRLDHIDRLEKKLIAFVKEREEINETRRLRMEARRKARGARVA